MQTSTAKRHCDPETSEHTREDRFFSLDEQWYFTTREGLIMGPYESRPHAESESAIYIHFLNNARKPVVNLLKRRKMTIDAEPQNS